MPPSADRGKARQVQKPCRGRSGAAPASSGPPPTTPGPRSPTRCRPTNGCPDVRPRLCFGRGAAGLAIRPQDPCSRRKEGAGGQGHALHHRQPDGQELRAPHQRRHHPGNRPPPDQDGHRRLRVDDLRPGVHEHRVVPERHHLHRRRQGASCATAATRSSSSPRRPASSKWPISWRRASCPTRRSWRSGPTTSATTPTSTPTSSSSWRASATTPIRWGCCWGR